MNSLKFMTESCRRARCPRLGCTQQPDSVSLAGAELSQRRGRGSAPGCGMAMGTGDHTPPKMKMNFQGQSTQFQYTHEEQLVDLHVSPLCGSPQVSIGMV